MGCFNNLPNDVIWLILRYKIAMIEFIAPLKAYEEPFQWKNTFSCNLCKTTCDLALLSKRCLKIIKSKTVSFGDVGWLFKKGTLTN